MAATKTSPRARRSPASDRYDLVDALTYMAEQIAAEAENAEDKA